MLPVKALVLALLVAAAGCSRWTIRVRDKAAPNRVERKATRSEPRTVVQARRMDATRLEIKVKHLVSVTVDATVHYSARETLVESGHWLWEIVEMPLGLLMVWTTTMDIEIIPPSRTRKVTSRYKSFATTFLDPTTRAIKMVSKTNVIAKGDHFSDAPVRSYVNVRLPVEGAAVTYRILDDSRAVVREGTGTTDMFGAVEVDLGDEVVADRAVAVEVAAAGATSTVPIR